MDDSQEKDYVLIARYHIKEARWLFEELEAEGVRFCFEPYDGVREMDVFTAGIGGMFGQGAMMVVYVHEEDQEKFHTVHARLFDSRPLLSGEGQVAEAENAEPEPKPKKENWRDKLR
jgi:hypothetical protein